MSHNVKKLMHPTGKPSAWTELITCLAEVGATDNLTQHDQKAKRYIQHQATTTPMSICFFGLRTRNKPQVLEYYRKN